MLSLIDGQYFECEPVPSPVGELTVRFNPENMCLESYIGSRRIFIGPKYHNRQNWATIDPKTGEITLKNVGLARFRVVFGDFHVDFEQNFV